jgi:gas vesicle protein
LGEYFNDIKQKLSEKIQEAKEENNRSVWALGDEINKTAKNNEDNNNLIQKNVNELEMFCQK